MELKMVASRVPERGDLRPLAQYWLQQMLPMVDGGRFKDPEMEKEFQEWKAAREARKGA